MAKAAVRASKASAVGVALVISYLEQCGWTKTVKCLLKESGQELVDAAAAVPEAFELVETLAKRWKDAEVESISHTSKSSSESGTGDGSSSSSSSSSSSDSDSAIIPDALPNHGNKNELSSSSSSDSSSSESDAAATVGNHNDGSLARSASASESSPSDSTSEASSTSSSPSSAAPGSTLAGAMSNTLHLSDAGAKKQDASSSSSSSDEPLKVTTPPHTKSSGGLGANKRKHAEMDETPARQSFSEPPSKRTGAPSRSGERFYRVRPEEVEIKDDRLRDNTYDGKGGETFGAKAWNDLKIVRGKDFRREKTKKKRNTFFGGGAISMGVHSVAFADSDEE